MKETRKPDAAREKRFRALVMGEFRPEFKRAIAIAVRRALRQERQKQRAAQPEAEAAALRRSVHDALLRAQQAVWQAQEAETRRLYPAFSLEKELQNPDFVRLLTDTRQPMTVRRAYEAVHLADIQQDIARKAAQKTAAHLAALARRPRESGAAPQAGLPVHGGARSRAARAEIARRALRGEKVAL
ncbi:MAG TPA: hypothetical protein H9707_03110 [Candidatus Butyricicoccus avicola]|nr:hypothetical protein [Candidatus Butyricicoccus avicola]